MIIFFLLTVMNFAIQHYSGLCLVFDSTTNHFKLEPICMNRFTSINGYQIKYLENYQCMIPVVSGSQTYLTLTSLCNTATEFSQTRSFSLKQLQSSNCLLPETKSESPAFGTKVILGSECNTNPSLFKIVQF